MVLVIDAHKRYYQSVVNLNKSMFGLLYNATKIITVSKFRLAETLISLPIHIGNVY